MRIKPLFSDATPNESFLKTELKKKVFPCLFQHGYLEIDADSERVKGRTANYFHFRKTVKEDGYFVISVNVKAKSYPTFEIEGGSVPAGGVKMLAPEELIPTDRVTAHMLETRNFLQTSARKYLPFRPGKLAMWLNSEAAIEKIVNEAETKLPELFRFIETGQSSSNIWQMRNRAGV